MKKTKTKKKIKSNKVPKKTQPQKKNLSKQELTTLLTTVFKKYGARNPESWATSQVEEGINQLHRFLFLREAWKQIIDDVDSSWMDAHIAQAKKHPTAPYAGIGLGLQKILQKGVHREDIIDVVRGMQANFLYNFCFNLEDPFADEAELANANISWALAETKEDLETGEIRFTGKTIQALHESVLNTDPTGREMRPRETKKTFNKNEST